MKRLFALILALLSLTSCASMLEREATYTADHVEDVPSSPGDAYWVNTFSGLCSALRPYVEEGMEEGSLRFPTTYPGNLTVDLEKAKRKLMEEDPLGCYAVEDVTFHVSRIITYYDVKVTFDYRVPPEKYMTMDTVYDPAELDRRVEETIGNFDDGFTLLLALPGASDTALADSLRRVYDRCPQTAFGYPELQVTYYPEDGTRVVAEVTFLYSESPIALRLRQRTTLRAAQELADGELAAVDGHDTAAIYRAVVERFAYDRSGGSTTGAAFLDGKANDEGLARAYLLLCRLKDNQEAAIVSGPDGWAATGGDTPLLFKPQDPSVTQLTTEGGETP